MIIFKTSAETLDTVLREAKHAVPNAPKRLMPGETILIAQTITSLKDGEKSIRWMMDFVRSYRDINNESKKLWGRSWNYIVEGKNVRAIKPFTISELQVSNKDYGGPPNYVYLEAEDEREIRRYIGK